MKELIPPGVPVITVSKGICSNKYFGKGSPKEYMKLIKEGADPSSWERDPTYCMTMDQAINLALGEGRNPVAALAGPSFAKQICQSEATACSVACIDEQVARNIAVDLSTPLFRLFYTSDIIGAELSGALKNVVAIACGMCWGCPHYNIPKGAQKKLDEAQEKILALASVIGEEKAKQLAAELSSKNIIDASKREYYVEKKGGQGLKFGPNALCLLLTRAWEDVRKLCVACGSRSETLLTLSGLGDLMLTCFGGESRNCKFGGVLGEAAFFDRKEADACLEAPTPKFVLEHPDNFPVCEGYCRYLRLSLCSGSTSASRRYNKATHAETSFVCALRALLRPSSPRSCNRDVARAQGPGHAQGCRAACALQDVRRPRRRNGPERPDRDDHDRAHSARI